MSFICSSTTSTSSPLVSKVARRQVFSFLYPRQHSESRRIRPIRNSHKKSFQQDGSNGALEEWFISSLARAGTCPQHAARGGPSSSFFTARRPELEFRNKQRQRLPPNRFKHTAEGVDFLRKPGPKTTQRQQFFDPENITLGDLGDKRSANTPPQPPKKDLMDLVDLYDGEMYSGGHPYSDPPDRYAKSDGPRLMVSDKTEDEWPPPHHAWPADIETKRKLLELDLALLDWHKDPEVVFKLYRDLPGPRVPYMTSKSRHKFLRHLAVVERKDEQSMLRYLSVVDDMKTAAIPLSVSEWTSALSFVSKYVSRTTDIEVEAALHMWREMEHVAGVKGNEATFNVLFDVACKAGKFTLAEMIYKEMEDRGYGFNRYHHVSLIHYYGLKRNGDGARQAYKELVEAGEMVDTVVLNAMISALINSQEPNAAENTYQRMKNRCLEGDESEKKPQPNQFKARRLITASLIKLATKAKRNPAKREQYQKRVSIVPDSQTYRILINYFAVQVGDLTKVAELLHDVRLFQLPSQGSLFLALFKGFAVHGGVLHTAWTSEHLDRVFNSFTRSIDEKEEDLYIAKWMVVWILRAFAKCSGKSRTIEVWETIQARWKPSENDTDFIMSTLRLLLEDDISTHGSLAREG